MKEWLMDAVVFFLLIYAVFDLLHRLVGFLFDLVGGSAQMRPVAMVFSDNNTDELEGLIRGIRPRSGTLYVVDIRTDAEGHAILEKLSKELGYLHVCSPAEAERICSH